MKSLKRGCFILTSVMAWSMGAPAAGKAETIECKFTEETSYTEPSIQLGTIKLNLHDCHPDSLDSEKKFLKRPDGKTVAVSLELYCSMASPSMNLIDVKMFEDGKYKSTMGLSLYIPDASKGMSFFGSSAKLEVSCKVQ